MSDQLADALTALRVERKAETLRKGWQEIPRWVFCSETGTPLHKSDFERRVFHKLFNKARLRHIRFHDLRHSFASRLIQNGESLAYVKEQMGHHSIQITVDIYGHLVPGANRAAVNRLDENPQDATIRNPAATGVDYRDRVSSQPLDVLGEPCGTRTHDPLIKRRGPVMSRPSVFLHSSAQPCVGARVLVQRVQD